MQDNDVIAGSVIKAVTELNHSGFRLTGIKVELEAQLGRRNISGERVVCPECIGDGGYSCENTYCEDGYVTCATCTDNLDCDDPVCDDGLILCSEGCDDGWHSCSVCNGDGMIDAPENENRQNANWGNVVVCQDFILKQLRKYYLAQTNIKRDGTKYDRGYGQYRPRGALKYCRFYVDGSVDSEFTFTLSTKNPEKILLLTKVIEAFKELAKANGNPINTERAGMHVSFLQGKKAVYPIVRDRLSEDELIFFDNHKKKFENYQRSMQQLLPAMYFLGASCGQSRELGFRAPRISNSVKHSAIYYTGGALEFRLFDTCYNRPQQIFDNLIVMRNTMRYWTVKYKNPGLDKITKAIKFGRDNSRELDRFYATYTHIDLLNEGLKRLKPRYYTITELKQQRKFNLTKRQIKQKLNEVTASAEEMFKKYEKDFKWQMAVEEYHAVGYALHNLRRELNADEPDTKLIKQAKKVAQEKVDKMWKAKQEMPEYIKRHIDEYNSAVSGSYRLELSPPEPPPESPQPNPYTWTTTTGTVDLPF